MPDKIKDVYNVVSKSNLFLDESDFRDQLSKNPQEVFDFISKSKGTKGLFLDYDDFETNLDLKKKVLPSKSYVTDSQSLLPDFNKKGLATTPMGIVETGLNEPKSTEITLKEKAPTKQYYNQPLEKGLVFDKEGKLYAPSSEALTKQITKAEELDLQKSTQKDLVEQAREMPQKKISIEPSFFGFAPEVKLVNEGEQSALADFSSAMIKGQIQGKIASILSAGRKPTDQELGEIAQLQSDSQFFPVSKAEKIYQEKGLTGLFKENKLLGTQFLLETMGSSLSSLFEASKKTVPAGVVAGAAAGAPFGGIGALPGAATGLLAGQLTAGYNISTSQRILDLLAQGGVDLTNKESLIKAFSDEKKMSKIRSNATKYGIPILLFDAATAGLAGKLAAGAVGKSLAKKLLAGAGETAIQMGGGMGGELAAQLASGQKVNWDEVALEGLAELPGGVTEVGVGVYTERSKASSSNKNLATQIATQGKENGVQDAIINLDRDLKNKVITPEEYQDGVQFVEKASQVADKIPDNIVGENRAKSIELLAERSDLKAQVTELENQKKSLDEAYHLGINEQIKEINEKVKNIDSEVFKIAKTSEEKTAPAVIMPEEVVQPEVIEVTPEEKISVITPEENVQVEVAEVKPEKLKVEDKLAAFRDKYNLINKSALKGAETKRINQEAGKIVTTDADSAVLSWLTGKDNQLQWKAINEAAGRVEAARLNVGRDYSTEEVKIRDYAAKNRTEGVTLDKAVDDIWRDVSKRNPNVKIEDVKNALLNAIRENPTRTDAARTLVARSGAETAPVSIEEGEQAYYERKGEPEVIVEQTPEGYKWEGGFVPFEEEDIEGLEEAPFAVQEATTEEVNDMKDIVKDLVDEGVLNLSTIKSRVSKALGYDSKRLRQTIEDAYQEYTKEYTPKEVTSGILGKVGNFLSDLFGGKAKDRVFIAKDGRSLMAKYSQISETGGRAEFQATLGNGETVTAKPVDASIVNGFYSPLELQINQMKQDKMPAKQWLDKLRGEEAKWTGLADWLSQQEGSLTKENIKNWLQDNQIEINEIIKGEPNIEDQSLWKFESRGDGQWTFNFERGGYFKIDASEGDGFARLYVQNPGSAYVNEIASFEYYDRGSILDMALEKAYFDDYLEPLSAMSSTKYSKYTLDGNKSDYKEILITLPTKLKNNLQDKLDQLDNEEQEEINKERDRYVSELGLNPSKKQLYFFALNDDNDVIYLAKDADDLDKWKDSHLYAMSVQQEAPAGLKNLLQFNKYFNVTNDALEKIRTKIKNLENEIANSEKEINPKYKSSHFDEDNILVHVRSDIRTDSKGNKIYFIEEVQSDWGQEGKKKGFIDASFEELQRYNELKSLISVLEEASRDAARAVSYAYKYDPDYSGFKEGSKSFYKLSIKERKDLINNTHETYQNQKDKGIEFLKEEISKRNKKISDNTDEVLLLEKKEYQLSKFLESVKNNKDFNQANKELDDLDKKIRSIERESVKLEEENITDENMISKLNIDKSIDNFEYDYAIRNSEITFDKNEYAKITKEYQDLTDKIENSKIKKAPFVTKTNDWAKLGLKVALKNAVQAGATKIAWTNGEQQNERYDLSKEVDYIRRIEKDENSFYLDISLPRGMINLVVDNDGIIESQKGSMLSNVGSYVGKSLADLIGKDIADRVLSNGDKTYAGENLKIGGKGMIGFYGSPKNDSLGILGDLAKSLYKQTPEKIILDNYREEKLKSLQAELDENTANKTSDFRMRDFHLNEAANETDLEEKEYNLKQADYYDKRGKNSAELEESVLREIKRLGVEYQYSINITPELKAQVEVGLPLFMSDPNGDVLGFSFQNKVYLNGEKLNPNTPIHEAGHIWTDWVRQNDPKIYERGMQLIEGSDYLKKAKASRFYQKEAMKLSSKAEVEQYFKNEALAMAIGDKGAQFVTESKKASFKEWLNTLWSKIKDVIGFRDISPEELQDLTLDQFAKMAVKDILGEQFETRPMQEAYDILPKGKKLRQSKEETLIKNNFENIVNELIKKKKIQKIC